MHKKIIQVFSFDFLSKIIISLIWLVLIRFMLPGEYAGLVFALSVVTGLTGALIAGFNRVYIVGYEHLDLGSPKAGFLSFQLIVSVIFLTALILIIRVDKLIFWNTAFLVIATCFSEFSKTYYQNKLKFIVYSVIEISRTLMFSLVILVLLYFLKINVKAWQVLFCQTVTLVVIFMFSIKGKIRLNEILDLKAGMAFASRVINSSYGFLFGYLFVLSFFSQVDIFVLKLISGNYELATYGSAMRYYNLVMIFQGSFNTVLLPMIKQCHGPAEFDEIINKNKRYLMFIIPLILLFMAVCGFIIPMIDQGRYPKAITVFRILEISAIISLWFSPYINMEFCFEDFKFIMVLICLIFPFYVGLCWQLSRQLGSIGAALSYLVSFGIFNTLTYIRAKKLENVKYVST